MSANENQAKQKNDLFFFDLTKYELTRNMVIPFVISFFLVFFLQAIRLIIAILVANFYEYVNMLYLILLGFSPLLAVFIAIIPIASLRSFQRVIGINVIILLSARYLIIIAPTPALQVSLAIILGVTSLYGFITVTLSMHPGKTDMILALIILPVLDLLFRGLAFNADLLYYFDYVQFTLSSILIILFVVSLITMILHPQEYVSMPSESNSNRIESFSTGIVFMLGLVIYLNYFANTGAYVSILGITYANAYVLGFTTFLVMFLVYGYLLIGNMLPLKNNKKWMIFLIGIIFIGISYPLIYALPFNNAVLLVFFWAGFYLLWFFMIQSTHESIEKRCFLSGIGIGLFMALLLILIQLLFNFPILALTYVAILSFTVITKTFVKEVLS